MPYLEEHPMRSGKLFESSLSWHFQVRCSSQSTTRNLTYWSFGFFLLNDVKKLFPRGMKKNKVRDSVMFIL